MAKRKSPEAKKDLAAEEIYRSKRRTSAVAIESGGDNPDEGILQGGYCESTYMSISNDVKADSPAQQDNRSEVEYGEGDKELSERFIGEAVSDEAARQRWPHRYRKNSEVIQATCHYLQAEVDGQVFCLEDDAYVQGKPGEEHFICKIKEFFQAIDGLQYFKAQWYFRASDTVIQGCSDLIETKRIFFSEDKNDNLLECIVKKIRIAILPQQEKLKSSSDYYCDKMYLPKFTSFVNFSSDAATIGSSEEEQCRSEKTVLDLYAGCGAMSTGLCIGANSAGVNLVTKWAVDFNQYACDSLRQNHRETQVRNETAEDFLNLLKEWDKLCVSILSPEDGNSNGTEDSEGDNNEEDGSESESAVFEVDEILAICYGNPNKNMKKAALHFQVRWKGYGSEHDSWEPSQNLSDCKEKLNEFVSRGQKSKILPLPGMVDVLCGGPPCQGISGFNRFRDKDEPLKDVKNKQLLVYMDIVAFLKPRFVLMENVVDIVQFSGGYLGRYGIGSLVSMGYQVRLGLMAAGAYGLPQFRRRMFMWGACSTERLPQYPLPTHIVVSRGNIPTQFEDNVVDFEKGVEIHLRKALCLGDAISDLPHVENNEDRDEMPYNSEAQTEFQHFIRLRRDEMPGFKSLNSEVLEHKLYDHCPYLLNKDDYARVRQIPKRKGANFRDLPGLRICEDGKKVEWDPSVPKRKLESGKQLIPEYAVTFKKGTSKKPFGRLWWDETVSTVVTRAQPHNQKILHPDQDRVLTVRENARLQGFPDFYQLSGPVKQRYMQVGNAVAVPVARALGYSLALAMKRLSGNEPVFTLPEDYPMLTT